jgi:SSS family solute:Na+ symporter
MTLLDWLEVLLPCALVVGVVLYARRYMTSVADFMTGGRSAGRYIIGLTRGQQGTGAIMMVGLFEVFYQSGFTTMWWQQLTVPVGLTVAMTGFVYYRYRQTRVMTLAQFFEMRYSRRFRIFTGSLGFLAGIMNFGIVPCIGARFFVAFLELPQTTPLFSLHIPTYLLLMTCFLTLSVLQTTSGGQVTILASGCVEGIFSQIALLIGALFLLSMFSWSAMSGALLDRPHGLSMVNPFDSFSTKDFNLTWVLMGLFLNNIYGTMAWQNNHAFNASGVTPHEAQMGNFFSNWITYGQLTIVTVFGLAVTTFLHQHTDAVAATQAVLGQYTDTTTIDQMRLPVAFAHLLPMGIKGLLCAVFLMGVISGDGIHLHSWSSIFVQDVLMPLRSRPLSLKQHLLWLRLSIAGVALFAFCFGALFKQAEYVLMWFQVTTAIFVGGAGSAIIGGLYWNRGTTAGAWTGMLTGSILSVTGIIVRITNPHFPFNGTEIAFAAALTAIAVYVVVSLLTCRQPYDMDQLLHRGKYAVAADHATAAPEQRRFSISKIIGINENFTHSDRWIAYGIFWWTLGWFFVVFTGSILQAFHPFSDQAWVTYWLWTAIALPLLVAALTCLGVTIGGARDFFIFFHRMHQKRLDLHDDGTVEKTSPP